MIEADALLYRFARVGNASQGFNSCAFNCNTSLFNYPPPFGADILKPKHHRFQIMDQMDEAWEDFKRGVSSDPQDQACASASIATILAHYAANDEPKWKVFPRLMSSQRTKLRARMLLALLHHDRTLFEEELPLTEGRWYALPIFRLIDENVPAEVIASILRSLPHLVMVTDRTSDAFEWPTDNGVLPLIGDVLVRVQRYPLSCWYGTTGCQECSWCRWRNLQREAVKSLPVLRGMPYAAMVKFYADSFQDHFVKVRVHIERRVVWMKAALAISISTGHVPDNVASMIGECLSIKLLQESVRELLGRVPMPTALQYWQDLGEKVAGVNPRNKKCSLAMALCPEFQYAASEIGGAADSNSSDCA